MDMQGLPRSAEKNYKKVRSLGNACQDLVSDTKGGVLHLKGCRELEGIKGT